VVNVRKSAGVTLSSSKGCSVVKRCRSELVEELCVG
jgi:hypothetical protein